MKWRIYTLFLCLTLVGCRDTQAQWTPAERYRKVPPISYINTGNDILRYLTEDDTARLPKLRLNGTDFDYGPAHHKMLAAAEPVYNPELYKNVRDVKQRVLDYLRRIVKECPDSDAAKVAKAILREVYIRRLRSKLKDIVRDSGDAKAIYIFVIDEDGQLFEVSKGCDK